MIERFFEWQSSTVPKERKQSNESTWEYLRNMDGQARKHFLFGGILWVVLSPVWVSALILEYNVILMIDLLA